MKQKFTAIIIFLIVGFQLDAQIQKVEPMNWWVGMENPNLELLVYGKNINESTAKIKGSKAVVKNVINTESENYLILQLDLSQAKVGDFQIILETRSGKKYTIEYSLLQKQNTNIQGFDASDVVYLITPDRFVNGNPNNDKIKDLKDQSLDRKEPYARHGGDIQGIIQSLDYIEEMGFTALWSSPLLINDMNEGSYHGYAITDMYTVDPRFGTLEEYKKLANGCHSKGIKLIMDMVANHIGLEHLWMKDRPFKNWINEWAEYTQTNHRRTVNQDRYASERDKEIMEKGWFVPAMPDLNQRDPRLATYLIQNNIWWIETLGLQGIRQDTYPYPNKEFMAKWCKSILQEYPSFSIVGEEWSYNPLLIGYWQNNHPNSDGYQSYLSSSMDFAMQEKISNGLKNEESWGSGLVEIYEGLANDFNYQTPNEIFMFMDNHDMDRIATQLNDDPVLVKMALGYMLMMPRIPQIYYGTEILMSNTGFPGNHGVIRTDFPGGWKGDKVNAISKQGLTKDQKDVQNFLQTVLKYRKNNTTISEGQTTHFIPQDNVYVLFRWDGVRKIMVILNKNEKPYHLNLDNFSELNIAGNGFRDIVTGKHTRFKNEIPLAEKGIYIYEVMAL